MHQLSELLLPVLRSDGSRVASRRSLSAEPLIEEAQLLDGLAEDLLVAAVATEKSRGASWEAIGKKMGIARTSAHGRFASLIDHRFGAQAIDPEFMQDALLRHWLQVEKLCRIQLSPATRRITSITDAQRRMVVLNLGNIIESQDIDFGTRVAAAHLKALVGDERPAEAILERIIAEDTTPGSLFSRSGMQPHRQRSDTLAGLKRSYPTLAGGRSLAGDDESIAMFEKLYREAHTEQGPDSNDTLRLGDRLAISLLELAIDSHDPRMLKKPTEIFEDHLRRRVELFGDQHSETIGARCRLAKAMRWFAIFTLRKDSAARALSLLNEAEMDASVVFNPDSPEVFAVLEQSASTSLSIGHALEDLNLIRNAISAYTRLLTYRENASGFTDDNTLHIADKLGAAYYICWMMADDVDALRNAARLELRSFRERTVKYGPNGSDTNASRNRLIRLVRGLEEISPLYSVDLLLEKIFTGDLGTLDSIL